MPVYTVVTDVQCAAVEPTHLSSRQIGLTDGVPFLVPVQKYVGLLRPESVRVLDRAPIHGMVLIVVDERATSHEFVDGIAFAHGVPSAALTCWISARVEVS